MPEFYSGMSGPAAIDKLNALWDVSGNAPASAAAALISAGTATTKAGEASDSATAAANSATAAAASYDSFDDRYLGSKATNPTLDNDGAALLVGAIYWNTAIPEMRVWNGTAWLAVQSTTAATAAAGSATAANTSATNSANSATAAAGSATAANTSATNSANSATAAAGSATAANTSATNSANSATAAVGSATAAAASYDSFDDRYLGSKATNPTLDNDGTTLLVGAIYWNTAIPEMRVWDGTAWLAVQSTAAAIAAAGSASTATTKAGEASDSATLAQNWATQLGTPVSEGEYSSKYWAAEAAASAASAGAGGVVGPNSSINSSIVLFDGITGSLLKDSGITLASKAASGANSDITSLTGLTGDISLADSLQFDTAALATSGIGKIVWNEGEGTLEFGLKGGNVTLQVGQEQVILSKNNTGTTIQNGSVVYINGSQGQRPTIALASASSEITSSKTIGIATETILNGAEGFVTTQGVVRGINTSTFVEGAELWLASVAGVFTNTRPEAPLHSVFIGYCINSHASSGSLFVNVSNGYELDELHSVKINNLTSGDVLKYNSATALWENAKNIGGLVNTPTKTSAYSAQSNDLVLIDSILASFTVTLPSTPVNGDKIGLLDITNSCTSNPVLLAVSGGKTIEGDATGLSINMSGAYVEVMFNGNNWKLLDTPVRQDFQEVLISGSSIKTINGINILGSGDLPISGGSSGFEQTFLMMGA